MNIQVLMGTTRRSSALPQHTFKVTRIVTYLQAGDMRQGWTPGIHNHAWQNAAKGLE